jgi:cysteinyl-tRNA synthetase
MATKYLGETFDIHGGGMDLLFPHHESEIAQSTTASGKSPVKYWMHNNMITINGRKMGKSYNNTITLREMFFGGHELLEKAYDPMVIRFFILQTHYRSTLDFSNEALQASEKGLHRLLNAYTAIDKIDPASSSTADIKKIEADCYAAINDDFNTAICIANLFELARICNASADGSEKMSAEDITLAKKIFDSFLFDILGIRMTSKDRSEDIDSLMKVILEIRNEAKLKKDYSTSDKIRDELLRAGIEIKDTKDGVSWNYK